MKSWKHKLLHPKDREKDGTPNSGSLASTSPSSPTPAAAVKSYKFPPPESTGTSPNTSETFTLLTRKAPKTGAWSHSRKRSADRRLDPLGITVLHTPDGAPIADVVFVHGLGGTSQCTWAKNRDLDLFWPKEWLPLEPVVCNARILTFGYNAHFLAAGPGTIANISDFAKSLLFEMKFSNGQDDDDLDVGKYPIIFVVHSMGGLVFKKAYILGLIDNEYKDIMSSVQAVLFLSTPHRGTSLADILNRVLSASIFNHSPKQYIEELKRHSPTLEEINESFRHHAPSLKIFSFYETLQTPVGIRNVMILDKASSTLGYPGEITDPMNADHHNVCKFANRDDPSYRKIRGVLKKLLSSYHKIGRRDTTPKAYDEVTDLYAFSDAKVHQVSSDDEMKQAADILTTFSAPEEDLASLLDLWRGGTCKSILDEPLFVNWRDLGEGSQVLWLNAAPGSGKSVKMAFLISHMTEYGSPCSYFFFKDGDSTRRNAGSLLRSLAFQIARVIPSFRKGLLLLDGNGIKVEKMEARMIWEKLFVGCLFKLDIFEPIYLAIDALDESDSIKIIIGFLSKISISKVPIRVLVASRKLPEIKTAFDRISSTTTINQLSTDDNQDDIRLYAESEVEYMDWGEDFKHEVVTEISKRAESNFLWVTLALKEIMQCYSPEDIRNGLAEIPPGMDALYKRMEAGIARLKKPSDLSLARMILAWTTYSRRPLNTEELQQALKLDQFHIIDLRYAISQLCGHFVVVDMGNRVLLVHQTAREYLIKEAALPFSFTESEVQEELFAKTINSLFETRQRPQMKKLGLLPLYEYAATSWPHHMHRSLTSSDSSLTLLVRFFQGSSVLSWIQTLATSRKLKVLISASTTISAFIKRRKAFELTINPSQHRLEDIDFLEHWALDLLKIVGRFNGHLIQDPSAISKIVPQLCPHGSAMFQQFGKQTQILVEGLSDQSWDDCLAQVTVGSSLQALKLICSTHYLAASTSSGTVILWDTITFEEFRTISHGEYLSGMCFTDSGEFLATYGEETTKIWNVTTGRQKYKVTNYPECRALSMKFVEDDKKLIVGLNTRKVAELALDEDIITWHAIESPFLQEENTIPGAVTNSPTALAFTSDATYIVVGYRAFPLTLWNVYDKQRVKRCWRTAGNEHGNAMTWSGVNKVIWNPNDEDILGIYDDGVVFKWSPFEDLHQELPSITGPYEIQCSPSGTLFATSDVNGSVKLYNHHYFTLIYQLSSEDIITGLCFSADSKRFFDLRGSYCKVWEPNALVRLLDLDERGSEIDGSVQGSNSTSEAWAASPSPITALAARPQEDAFCMGNNNGHIEIYDLKSHASLGVGKMWSIDNLAWSENGSHFAYSDGRTIIVEAVNDKPGWSCSTILDVEVDHGSGMIMQILLEADAQFLLVTLKGAAQLWSVTSGTMLQIIQVPGPQHWTRNPHNSSELLAFDLDAVTAYTWKDLEVRNQWPINNVTPSATAPQLESPIPRPVLPFQHTSTFSDKSITVESCEYLDEVIITHLGNFSLLLISERGPRIKRWSRLQILPTAPFSIQDHSADPKVAKGAISLSPLSIPEDVAATIEKPLGLLGSDQLVFLDKSFWVCSWRLDQTGQGDSHALLVGVSGRTSTSASTGGSVGEIGNGRGTGTGIDRGVQRHFFLPRDWVNAEMLGLVRLLGNGTILCPRNGEVAVIRSGLGVDRW